MVMVFVSCAIRFWQEYRNNVAAIRHQSSVATNVRVRRIVEGEYIEVVVDEKTLVPGDILFMDPGDAIAMRLGVFASANLGQFLPLRCMF